MTETKELIQELVGLSEKNDKISLILEVRTYDEFSGATYEQKIVYLNEPDAPQQLQSAIDKVRAL